MILHRIFFTYIAQTKNTLVLRECPLKFLSVRGFYVIKLAANTSHQIGVCFIGILHLAVSVDLNNRMLSQITAVIVYPFNIHYVI